MTSGKLQNFLFTAITFALFCACGCSGRDWEGPPELRLGRDECAECGMMINEDRFSAGALVQRNGHREHVLFDDIGCFLDFERQLSPPDRTEKRFFRDYEQRKWLTSHNARFVIADREKLITPMASGMVAVERDADAERVSEMGSGKVATWDELVKARKAWSDSRRARAHPHH